MIYLDNSATTKPCPEAVDAMVNALTTGWANPSALYGFGIEGAKALRTARAQTAAAMGAQPDRVFFTSGGTEADNWAVFSTAKRFGKKNRHIITTAIEHHAIEHPMKELEAQGYEVTYLAPDALGRITLDALKQALRPDTFLVSIMMVNNETGAVMPIAQMAKLVHRVCPDAVFHTDAVQGFLKVPFQAKALGADLISVSSHKIHGPKGAGALYISPRLRSLPPYLYGGGQESGLHTDAVQGFLKVPFQAKTLGSDLISVSSHKIHGPKGAGALYISPRQRSLPPYLYGGGQESVLRSGTEAMPAIMGFAAACASGAKTLSQDSAHEAALRDHLIQRVSAMEGEPASGGRHLRQRRLRLRQGAPQPCTDRHECPPRGHRRGIPGLPVPV